MDIVLKCDIGFYRIEPDDLGARMNFRLSLIRQRPVMSQIMQSVGGCLLNDMMAVFPGDELVSRDVGCSLIDSHMAFVNINTGFKIVNAGIGDDVDLCFTVAIQRKRVKRISNKQYGDQNKS